MMAKRTTYIRMSLIMLGPRLGGQAGDHVLQPDDDVVGFNQSYLGFLQLFLQCLDLGVQLFVS